MDGDVVKNMRNGCELGPAISRRTLFQGVGIGLASAAFGPQLAFAANPVAPVTEFEYTGVSGIDPTAIPALALGSVIVLEKDETKRATGAFARCVSTSDETTIWSYPDSAQGVSDPAGFATPLVTGASVYLATATQVVALDAASGQQRWARDYPVAAVPGCPFALKAGRLMFRTTAPALVSIDAELGDGAIVQVLGGEPGEGLPYGAPVVSDAGVCIVSGGYIFQFTDELVPVHQHPIPASAHVEPSLAVGLDRVYYTNQGDSTTRADVVALDPTTWEQVWSVEADSDAERLSTPVVRGGCVYFGTSEGELRCVQEVDGHPEMTQFTLSGDLSLEPAVIDEGFAYVAAQGSTGADIWAVPLSASDDATPVKADAGFAGAAIVGVQSSVCYFSKTGPKGRLVVRGVNLQRVAGQFACESELMADDYVAGSDGSPMAQSPVYRTQLLVTYANTSPRGNSRVKIWASRDGVAVTSGGETHTVGTGDHVWLTTDGSGELDLTIAADEIDSAALYIWAPFMDEQDVMVVYPNQATLDTLANVQGDDLTALRTFAGGPVLPAAYDDVTKAEGLAQTIRSTLGNTAEAIQRTQALHTSITSTSKALSGSPDTYIAFPASSTNLVYESLALTSDRVYVADEMTNWFADVGADGIVTFTLGDPPLDLEAPGSSGAAKRKTSSFADFLDDLRDDAVTVKRLAHTVEKDAEKAVHTFVVTADEVYEFTIDTVEMAAAVLTAVVGTVVDDVGDFLEGFARILDWPAMVRTARALSEKVKTGLKTIATSTAAADAAARISAAQSILDSDLEAIETAIADAFSQHGHSTASAQPGYGDPKTFYGQNGAHSQCASKWIQQKVSLHAGKAKLADKTSAGSFVSAFDSLYATIEEQVHKSTHDFEKDVKSTFSNLRGLWGDDMSKFAEVALVDLLDFLLETVQDALDLILRSVEAVLASKILEDLVDGILEFLTAKIDIPIFSDLFAILTGGMELSFLHVICLVIAVPTEIIAGPIDPDGELGGSDAETALECAYTASMIVADAAGVATDVLDEDEWPRLYSALAGVAAAFTFIEVGLGVAVDAEQAGGFGKIGASAWLMQLAQLEPPVLKLWTTFTDFSGSSTITPAEARVIEALADTLVAIGFSGLSVYEFFESSFDLDDLLTLAENVLTFLPGPFEWIAIADPAGGGVDEGVCDAIAGAGAVAATIWLLVREHA